MLPKNPREGMAVYTQDSTNFKRPVFTHVCPISHDISTPIVVGIPDISNLTGKYSSIACAILYFYCLTRVYSSINNLFYTHLFCIMYTYFIPLELPYNSLRNCSSIHCWSPLDRDSLKALAIIIFSSSRPSLYLCFNSFLIKETFPLFLS